MHRTLHILAQTLSILCYPLWIPTYGIALFCVAYSRHVLPLPPVWQGVAIGGTLLLTCVIPLTAILLLAFGIIRMFISGTTFSSKWIEDFADSCKKNYFDTHPYLSPRQEQQIRKIKTESFEREIR